MSYFAIGFLAPFIGCALIILFSSKNAQREIDADFDAASDALFKAIEVHGYPDLAGADIGGADLSGASIAGADLRVNR